MSHRRKGRVCGLLMLSCAVFLAAKPGASARTLHSPADWSGTWHGVYGCAQGPTGLDLTITPLGARSVTAVFSFHAIPQNPLLPSGEFAMTRQVGPDGHLLLRAGAWTVQPPLYVTVDLDGAFHPGSAEYRGRVLGPGCSFFNLRRDTMA
jgi:hypothetical protein